MSDRAAARAAEPRTERPARPPVVLALVGPTGAGKTAVSMGVAPGLGAEVVSVDSMQVYRGMDVGTAKPSVEERRRVPHHLIDIADPGKPFSVAAFQSAARSAIDATLLRGRTPLLVGGSGLYYRAVVDELAFPPTDPAVRRAIEQGDPGDLAERLRAQDPAAAERIDPANVRRVVRALEVMELTSKRFSDFRSAWDRYESRYDLVAAGLRLPADALAGGIASRVDRMLEAGLVEEVRALLERGFRSSLTAARAIAYPEIVAYLDGDLSLDEARETIARNTRRYARRQMSWFRADPRIRWFDAEDTERAAGEIRAYYDGEIRRRTAGA